MSDFEASQLRNYKTIIIGKSAVGKSTLLLRYVEGVFNAQKPTIGIDYRFKKVSCGGVEFNLELWDSAGQERYRTIVYNYFTLSKAGCIVFDITDEDSLLEAKTWMQQLVLRCGNEIPMILLGNKCDKVDADKLEEHLQALQSRIDQITQQYDCKFFPVSAYSGQNLEEAFQYLIEKIYAQNKIVKEGSVKPGGFSLDRKAEQKAVEKKKTKQKCC